MSKPTIADLPKLVNGQIEGLLPGYIMRHRADVLYQVRGELDAAYAESIIVAAGMWGANRALDLLVAKTPPEPPSDEAQCLVVDGKRYVYKWHENGQPVAPPKSHSNAPSQPDGESTAQKPETPESGSDCTEWAG